MVFLLQTDLLNGLGRTEAHVRFRSIQQVAQFDLIERAALAGLDRRRLQGAPDRAVMLDDVAGLDFITIDLDHWGVSF